MRIMAILLALSVSSASLVAEELSDIPNFREYSPSFASSGQPTEQQLKLLKSAGYERIIYIAFSIHDSALAKEDLIVRELGMDYVQIPVIWDKPSVTDFYAFADVMRRYPDKKSLLHCQINFRASAFSFLYRVLYQEVPIDVAKTDMNTVWVPNNTWRAFIFSVLEENGMSAQCDACIWEE